MKEPFIALTARNQSQDKTNPNFGDNQSYFRYVSYGGGFPVLLPAVTEEEAEESAQLFDGLIITGGEDVNPKYYGEKNICSYLTDHDIDEADRRLYHAFVKAGKPVLGICRGIQVIAVAEGADLIQDIPTEFHTQHAQNKMDPPIPNGKFCHKDKFIKGTRLYDIFGDSYGVNSFHHQAVRHVPDGFTLAAISEDGIIEGIEKEHVTAVQWHPERLMNDPKHLQIIERFIAECASLRESR